MSYREAFLGVGGLIVVEKFIGDYQGDWVALVMGNEAYGPDGKVGVLVYGYGSCSGCDEWEASNSLTERVEILKNLVGSIKWFPTLIECKAWINGDAPKLEWYGNDNSNWASFLAEVNGLDDGLSFYELESLAEKNA